MVVRILLSALPVIAASLPAHADPSIRATDECIDCVDREWITAEPGTDPGVGSLARLELGSAGVATSGPKGTAVTAGLVRVRIQVALSRALAIRANGTAHVLRTSTEPFPFVGGAQGGGTLGVGLTRRLWWIKHGKIPISATFDGELATGPTVHKGLSMRTFRDDTQRLTAAAGLASGWDFYHGTIRAHARYLRALGEANDGDHAFEFGVGASTRINWAADFWGGAWPLEAWLDVRHRQGLRGSSARELETRGGFDYTREGWLRRFGVQLAGSRDRLGDGRVASGLTMLLTMQVGPN